MGIVVMLSLRMSMPQWQISRLRGLFNLLIGVLLVLSVVLTISHQQKCRVVLLLKYLLELIVNLISCTLSELLYIGTSVKVWKKVNFLKLVKIWLLWKRTMKKLELIQLKKKVMKVKKVQKTTTNKFHLGWFFGCFRYPF